MNIQDTIRRMMSESGTNGTALSFVLGEDRNAVSTMLSRASVPRLDRFVKMCDAMGYQVVLESADDRIAIDPPTEA